MTNYENGSFILNWRTSNEVLYAKNEIPSDDIIFDNIEITYGDPYTPKASVDEETYGEVECTYTCKESKTLPTDAGTYTLTVTVENDKYTGIKTAKLTINKKPLEVKMFPVKDATYTDSPIQPQVSATDLSAEDVNLIKESDYTVTFSNNIDARENTAEDAPTAIFTATEDGNYCGSLFLKFTIIPKSLEDDDVTVTFSPESSYYTDQPITPDVTVKFGNIDLVRDRDYTLEWEDNTDAGTATVSVKAYSDNYTDTKTAEFTILAAPASGKVTITGADNKVGTELTASVTGNTHILFQFTPLREGRLGCENQEQKLLGISIHAPARGATSG